MAEQFQRSNLSRESAPWGREAEDRIKRLEDALSRTSSSELNANKGQNSTMGALSGQVRALPIPVSGYEIKTGFNLSVGVMYIDVPIELPEGKTKVVFTAIANFFLLGNAGGSGTIESYIEVNGFGFTWSTPMVMGSRYTALGGIGNSATPALGFEQEDLTASFTVTLSLNTSTPGDFPTNANNFASITVTALFFD